jgi:HlyD family secretion protein
VDNQEMLLKPGMTATVEIVTEKLKGVLLVPNKALRFSPPKGDGFRFRGPPVPFLGRPGKGGGKGKPSNPMKAIGKVKGNQGVLWTIDRRGPAGILSPVKVDKLASDGVRTAIRSEAIAEGDEVVVEQLNSGKGEP